MSTCFVIQPFDKARFDKRFDDVFAPAIVAAGLEAYRVDRGPSVNVPIDNIETGIRGAIACLADITTDNPNVWFELGFAIAAQKDVGACSVQPKEPPGSPLMFSTVVSSNIRLSLRAIFRNWERTPRPV